MNNKKTSKIVLVNILAEDVNHFNKIKQRHANVFSPDYLINKDGGWVKSVRNGSNPYISEYTQNITYIGLFNYGVLNWDEKNDVFKTIHGKIIESNVFNKKWNSFEHWENYTEFQIESVIDVTKQLMDSFGLKQVKKNNVYDPSHESYSGVCFGSNLSKYCLHTTPAFDYKKFQNRLLPQKV